MAEAHTTSRARAMPREAVGSGGAATPRSRAAADLFCSGAAASWAGRCAGDGPGAQHGGAALPVLQVALDTRSRLAWRKPGEKRWRGACRSIEQVCAEADAAGVPAHCVIDYVER